MVSIRFIQPLGEEAVVDGAVGASVMEAAIAGDVPGITADCGGAASCGTCHAYVDPAWADRIDPPAEMEEQMLEFVMDREPNSRLTCQIRITEALEGIRFDLPPT
jgi:ferredoxin, 2Fe-2S